MITCRRMPWPVPSSPGTYTSSGAPSATGACTGLSRHSSWVGGMKLSGREASARAFALPAAAAPFCGCSSAASASSSAAREAVGSPMTRVMSCAAVSTSAAADRMPAELFAFAAAASAADADCSASCAATWKRKRGDGFGFGLGSARGRVRRHIGGDRSAVLLRFRGSSCAGNRESTRRSSSRVVATTYLDEDVRLELGDARVQPAHGGLLHSELLHRALPLLQGHVQLRLRRLSQHESANHKSSCSTRGRCTGGTRSLRIVLTVD
eukprot:1194791-Prorocentrum_minimum.AAC.4